MIANPFPCPIIPGIAELFDTPLPKITLPKESEPKVYLYRDLFLKEYERNNQNIWETKKDANANTKNPEKNKPEKKKKKKKNNNSIGSSCNTESEAEDDPTLALPERACSSLHKRPSKLKPVEAVNSVLKPNQPKPPHTKTLIYTHHKQSNVETNDKSKKFPTDPSYDLLGSLLGNSNSQKAVLYESPACMEKELYKDSTIDKNKSLIESTKPNQSSGLLDNKRAKKNTVENKILTIKDSKISDHNIEILYRNQPIQSKKLSSNSIENNFEIEKAAENESPCTKVIEPIVVENPGIIDENRPSIESMKSSLCKNKANYGTKNNTKGDEVTEPLIVDRKYDFAEEKNDIVNNSYITAVEDCHKASDSDSDGDFGGDLSICFGEESEDDSENDVIFCGNPINSKLANHNDPSDSSNTSSKEVMASTDDFKKQISSKEENISKSKLPQSSYSNNVTCLTDNSEENISSKVHPNKISNDNKNINKKVPKPKTTKDNIATPKKTTHKSSKGLLHAMKTLKKRSALSVKPNRKPATFVSVARTKSISSKENSNLDDNESNIVNDENKVCSANGGSVSTKSKLEVERDEDSVPTFHKRSARKLSSDLSTQDVKCNRKNSIDGTKVNERESSMMDNVKICKIKKELVSDKSNKDVKRKLLVKRSIPKTVEKKIPDEGSDEMNEKDTDSEDNLIIDYKEAIWEKPTLKRKLPVKRTLSKEVVKKTFDEGPDKTNKKNTDSEDNLIIDATEACEKPTRKRKLPVKRSLSKEVVKKTSDEGPNKTNKKNTDSEDNLIIDAAEACEKPVRKRKLPVKRTLSKKVVEKTSAEGSDERNEKDTDSEDNLIIDAAEACEKPVRKRKLPVKRSLPKKVVEKASKGIDKMIKKNIDCEKNSKDFKGQEIGEKPGRKRKLRVTRSSPKKVEEKKSEGSGQKNKKNTDAKKNLKDIEAEEIGVKTERKRKLPVKRSLPKKVKEELSDQSFVNNISTDFEDNSLLNNSVNSSNKNGYGNNSRESMHCDNSSDNSSEHHQVEEKSEERKYPRRSNRSHIDNYSNYSNSYQDDFKRAIKNSRNDVCQRQQRCYEMDNKEMGNRNKDDYRVENRNNNNMGNVNDDRMEYKNNDRVDNRSNDKMGNSRDTRSTSRQQRNEGHPKSWYNQPPNNSNRNSSDFGRDVRDTNDRRMKHKSPRQMENRRAYMSKYREDRQREIERKAYEKTMPCVHYKKYGHCKFGDECKFSHDIEVDSPRYECCRYYVVGACNKGDECTRLHEEWPCKFFHTIGKCNQKDNCRFSHDPMSPALKEAFEARLQEEEAFNAERLAAEEAEAQAQAQTQTRYGGQMMYDPFPAPPSSSSSPIKTFPPPSNTGTMMTSTNSPVKPPDGGAEPAKTVKEFQFPSLYYELT